MPNAEYVFLCKKKSSTGEHDKMDGDCYKTHFAGKLLPYLPPQLVTLMLLT
jgi:hypothetical protein